MTGKNIHILYFNLTLFDNNEKAKRSAKKGREHSQPKDLSLLYTGSLFYVTNVLCHLSPLYSAIRAGGRSAGWVRSYVKRGDRKQLLTVAR